MITKHVSVKFARFHPVDAILWIPVAFLIGNDERTIGIQTDSVRCPKACRYNFSCGSIWRNLKQCSVVWYDGFESVPGGFGVIKIPGGILLQTHCKFMEVFGYLVVIIETSIVVDQPISIRVPQFHQLIPTGNHDAIIDHKNPQRLE